MTSIPVAIGLLIGHVDTLFSRLDHELDEDPFSNHRTSALWAGEWDALRLGIEKVLATPSFDAARLAPHCEWEHDDEEVREVLEAFRRRFWEPLNPALVARVVLTDETMNQWRQRQRDGQAWPDAARDALMQQLSTQLQTGGSLDPSGLEGSDSEEACVASLVDLLRFELGEAARRDAADVLELMTRDRLSPVVEELSRRSGFDWQTDGRWGALAALLQKVEDRLRDG